MQIDGQCHCGRIAYRAVIDPAQVGICHCTDCQILTGSPYRVSVPARVQDFTLLHGRPKIYVKRADSGNERAQAFCPDCGTPIYAAEPRDPTIYQLRFGAIRQRTMLRPKRQIWCRSAQPWAQDIAALPKFNRYPE